MFRKPAFKMHDAKILINEKIVKGYVIPYADIAEEAKEAFSQVEGFFVVECAFSMHTDFFDEYAKAVPQEDVELFELTPETQNWFFITQVMSIEEKTKNLGWLGSFVDQEVDENFMANWLAERVIKKRDEEWHAHVLTLGIPSREEYMAQRGLK